MQREKRERAILVGCGRLGALLADRLADGRSLVTVLDRNARAFRKLSGAYSGLTLEGDGSDFDTLVEAGAHEATLLVATTDDDDTNCMVAQIAKEIFKIDRVIVRLNETEKQAAFAGSGIIVLSPALLCVQAFEALLGKHAGEHA